MGTELVHSGLKKRVRLGRRAVEYRLIRASGARKLRVRVGPDGVEVFQPPGRNGDEVAEFLVANSGWILREIDRVGRLGGLRRPTRRPVGEIPFRGDATPVRIEGTASRATGNAVRFNDGEIVIARGSSSRTPAARSLELWLRREARREIQRNVAEVAERLGERPGRIYLMSQRTKWGNCSSRRNLSFNWRLILAPDYVLQYLATHETVHLAIPDHSAKFWLAVQSLCPESERARRYLSAEGRNLWVDLGAACRG